MGNMGRRLLWGLFLWYGGLKFDLLFSDIAAYIGGFFSYLSVFHSFKNQSQYSNYLHSR